jgi:uncharacterized protein YfbU (UPF0304 family)
MNLSKTERLLLYNQYEILKLLHGKDKYMADEYERLQKIVGLGFKHEYEELTSCIQDELPDSRADFVWDVLQMFEVLEDSYKELTDSQREEIDPRRIKFSGFDGNNEAEYLMYVEFIVKDMGRFKWLCDRESLNSHMPRLSRYSRMLGMWEQVRSDEYSSLDLEQFKAVIGV